MGSSPRHRPDIAGKEMRRGRLRGVVCAALLAAMLLPALGCRPSRANIELRRENQQLRARLGELERLRDAQREDIRNLRQQLAADAIPTLPPEHLDKLFTTHGLRIGRLTGGVDLDPDTPWDDGLQVHVVPLDQTDGLLKAAGSFVVEAFDLARPDGWLIGRWTFDRDEAAERWVGRGLMYGYTLICPWQEVVPRTGELTLRVTFVDALTGRAVWRQQTVTINPPEP